MKRIAAGLIFLLVLSIPWQAVGDPPKSHNRVALLKSSLPGSDVRFAMAIAKGWSRLVLPGLLVGIWGYAIGTFLGVLVSEVLRFFFY